MTSLGGVPLQSGANKRARSNDGTHEDNDGVVGTQRYSGGPGGNGGRGTTNNGPNSDGGDQ